MRDRYSAGIKLSADCVRLSLRYVVSFGLRKPHHNYETEESSMKNRKILSLLLAGTMTAALLAVPAQAADFPDTIRVSSYKGSTLV